MTRGLVWSAGWGRAWEACERMLGQFLVSEITLLTTVRPLAHTALDESGRISSMKLRLLLGLYFEYHSAIRVRLRSAFVGCPVEDTAPHHQSIKRRASITSSSEGV